MADNPKTTYSIQDIFNYFAVDTDADGVADALAVCNPDGSEIGS